MVEIGHMTRMRPPVVKGKTPSVATGGSRVA